MSNPNFLTVTAQMILEVQRRGLTPMAFVMNRATQEHIAEELWLVHRARMSALARFWHWLRHGRSIPLMDTLHGLPVMENAMLQDGGVFLQSTGTEAQGGMGVTDGLEQAAKAAAEENQRRGAEFWEKQRVNPPAVPNQDAAPTLNDLASGNGERPTASDVLIKALDHADELAGVVVIRIYANKDLDMAMNVDPYACQGILAKAQQYLFMKGM